MTFDPIIEAVAQQDMHASSGEYADIDYTLFADADIADLAKYVHRLQALRRAASHVESVVKDELARRLAHHRGARIGRSIWRVVPKPTRWRIGDPAGFARFLGEDVGRVFRLSGSNLRATQLRQVAHERGWDEATVRDTFGIDRPRSEEMVVSEIPVEKAPKAFQRLADGDIL